ncbi:transmembrane protein, putative [Medicago truncatula]|uniref:Transmembrane protein, putative n=1 Tax=Medicago truncatula TaxID=3880 RepID=G7IRS6_MEDTR|nr:transmembrane protein, putative [Medicago truncatula]
MEPYISNVIQIPSETKVDKTFLSRLVSMTVKRLNWAHLKLYDRRRRFSMFFMLSSGSIVMLYDSILSGFSKEVGIRQFLILLMNGSQGTLSPLD